MYKKALNHSIGIMIVVVILLIISLTISQLFTPSLKVETQQPDVEQAIEPDLSATDTACVEPMTTADALNTEVK